MTRSRRPRPAPLRAAALATLLAGALPLSGCDLLGIESATTKAASREAEGRAVGSACRHAGRALEDCYAYNPTASKAAVFAGWKSMNDYMAENKIDTIRPVVEAKLPQPKRRAAPAGAAASDEGAKAGEAQAAEAGSKESSARDAPGKPVAALSSAKGAQPR